MNMRTLGLVPLVFVLLSSNTASADPANTKLADALFAAGKDAMARGDLATACGRFAESLKLDPATGTFLNLAACEERSGKLVAALEHFTAARSRLREDDYRIAFADERIANVSKRVARLVVRFAKPPALGTTRVLRDDVEIPPQAFGTPLVVDPGPHTLVVETSGHSSQRTRVELREGEQRVVDLELPAEKATVVRPVATEQPSSTRLTLAWVTGGLGVAGLVTGAVTGLVAIDAANTYRAHCTNGLCDDEGLSAAATGRTVSIVSPVAFAAGAAFVLGSLYLFLSQPERTVSSARAWQ